MSPLASAEALTRSFQARFPRLADAPGTMRRFGEAWMTPREYDRLAARGQLPAHARYPAYRRLVQSQWARRFRPCANHLLELVGHSSMPFQEAWSQLQADRPWEFTHPEDFRWGDYRFVDGLVYYLCPQSSRTDRLSGAGGLHFRRSRAAL